MQAVRRSLRRTHFMAALAVVLLAAVLGGTGLFLLRDRRATLDAVTTAQSNMALGLERDILRNIDIYDLSLRAAANGVQFLNSTGDPAAQDAILFDGSTAARHFRPVVIADENGRVVRDAAARTPRIANIAGAGFFQLHRAQDDLGLLVLLNTRSTIDGRPYLSMTRRINRPDGSFAGTVSGGLDLTFFQEIFSRFTLPPGGAIALVGYDGRLVAGYPFHEEDVGRDVSGTGLIEQAMRADGSSFETVGVTDGVTRVTTVRRLGRLPFFLAVGTPVRAVYAEWRQRAVAAGLGLAAMLAASLLLFLALRRELSRRRLAERDAVTAELAARASEARLSTYIDCLADGILAISGRPDGGFVYERVNAAAAEMLGVRADDLLGRSLSDAGPAAFAPAAVDKCRECMEAGTPLRYEQDVETAAGHRVIRLVLAPVAGHHGRGNATLLLASLSDATATIAMEAKLRQAQRMEAVGQLTAGIAHDFNNMLQAQLGALELLIDEVGGQPDVLELAHLAYAAGEHGAKLTHSLLSFSRQQHLAPRAVPLGKLFDGLRTILSRTLGPRIALHVAAEDGAAPPFADPAQLEAALLNLSLNARDAMPNGGALRIEATSGRAADIPDGMPADSIVVAVSDTGSGMPPDVLARACEPFFTTKGVGQGSGLGLSMVQGFAQQSAGTMRIFSTPGEGTTVELWLPGAATETHAAQPSTVPIRRSSGRGRVLLVDDVSDVLAVSAGLLEAAGFEVVQAAHGEEALLLLETERRFDVLVTDYLMPGMDGSELIRQADAMAPGLPALVVTGYAESDVLCRLPPHVAVVRKPLRGECLVRRVSDLLASTRQEPAASTSNA